MYTLFILSTLDNYPDIQFGIYHEKPLLMLFYLSYAIFGGIVMVSILTGVSYTNFVKFYSHNLDVLLKDPEYRILFRRCLRDKILNFENIIKILNDYLENKRKIIEDMRREEISEEELEEVDLMNKFHPGEND
jgi:Ion transport protein